MSSSPLSTLSRSKRGNEIIGVDDEHRLIARYVERLANYPYNAMPLDVSNSLNIGVADAKERHHLVAELEAKNREILREIQHLRMQQQTNQSDFNSRSGTYNPALTVELQLLRQRRDELETRMKTLQGSRRELMLQLETLMKFLKNPLALRSTPANSPCSRILAPSLVTVQHVTSSSNGLKDSVAALSSDLRQTFVYNQPQIRPSTSSTGSCGPSACYLRKDLISATDSVTDAVSSLVKELNCEGSGDSEGDFLEPFRAYDKFHHSPENRIAKSREITFIPDIHLHNRLSTSSGSGFVGLGEREGFLATDDRQTYNGRSLNGAMKQLTFKSSKELYDKDARGFTQRRHFTADDESCLETDQESFIRTDDDDEGGNTEWEDAMKRWINR